MKTRTANIFILILGVVIGLMLLDVGAVKACDMSDIEEEKVIIVATIL